jgi:glycosyltransferase involved in cell wall biosynthesis
MNSISVVVITFNEEENISRCLTSVQPVADEIIVVDSYSTDQTTVISAQLGAKVYDRAWEGYSSAKNYGNDQASKDWILSIDADEELSDELIKSILSFKVQQHNTTAFEVNRLTNYCGYWVKYCGWYPDQKLRLWKRGEGKWDGVLHEKIIFEKDVKTKLLTGDLFHFSFPSIHHHVLTLNKYSEVAAKDLVTRNKHVSFLLHVLLNPLYTFINKYFFRLGFLDGYHGFIICWLSAQANFLKYSKAFLMKASAQASR